MKRISALVVYLLLITVPVLVFLSTQVEGTAGGNHDECNDADVKSINPVNGSLASYTAASDKIVTAVCVKAGSDQQGAGHEKYTTNGTFHSCYTISGLGSQTVTVTKIGSGNACKDISHIDVYKGMVPTPTPTSQPTATPTPTEQPTPTPTPTPTEQPTPTPTREPSPTPTNTPRPTRTPTPTPTLEPTPTPTGEPEVTPTPTEQPEPTPTQTPTPEPTRPVTPPNPDPTQTPAPTDGPQPTSTPEDVTMDLRGSYSCEELNFPMTVELKRDGQKVADKDVTFSYRGEQKVAKTNADGFASVRFDYTGEGEVVAEADGFPTQRYAIQTLVCGGAVGGVSTEDGDILGITSYAATGSLDSFMFLQLIGMTLAGVGAIGYWKTR